MVLSLNNIKQRNQTNPQNIMILLFQVEHKIKTDIISYYSLPKLCKQK